MDERECVCVFLWVCVCVWTRVSNSHHLKLGSPNAMTHLCPGPLRAREVTSRYRLL